MYTFLYRNHKPFIIKAVGVLLLLFAFLLFLNTPLASVVMTVCSSAIFMYKKGVEIDFANRQFRYFTLLGPMQTGKWQPLGSIEYVSVFKATYSSLVTGRSNITLTREQLLYEVNLVRSNRQRLNACITSDKEEAFAKAHVLAKALAVNIYDASERETRWVVLREHES